MNPETARTTPPTPAKKSHATRIVLAILGVVLIAGLALFFRSRSGKEKAAAESQGGRRGGGDRIVPVFTAVASVEDVPVYLEGIGSVTANSTVTVRPQVDGRLDAILFREGQPVRKGELLAQIDPRPFNIELRQAQATFARNGAQLKNAQDTLARLDKLNKESLVPQQQVDDQRALVAQLRAQTLADATQIESARLKLDYARITSPIDGVTGVRFVDPGNLIRATDPNGIVVVTQIDPIAVVFSLPQDDLTAIHDALANGSPTVEAFSRDGSQRLAEGKLEVVDNAINQDTATVRLKAVFDNPEQKLWPNQFVKAKLSLESKKNAVVVPAAVVQRGPDGTFAYVVGKGDVAEVRPITVGSLQGEIALVDKGLAAGDQVIVDGQAQLRPGSKIAPKPSPGKGATAKKGPKP